MSDIPAISRQQTYPPLGSRHSPLHKSSISPADFSVLISPLALSSAPAQRSTPIPPATRSPPLTNNGHPTCSNCRHTVSFRHSHPRSSRRPYPSVSDSNPTTTTSAPCASPVLLHSGDSPHPFHLVTSLCHFCHLLAQHFVLLAVSVRTQMSDPAEIKKASVGHQRSLRLSQSGQKSNRPKFAISVPLSVFMEGSINTTRPRFQWT